MVFIQTSAFQAAGANALNQIAVEEQEDQEHGDQRKGGHSKHCAVVRGGSRVCKQFDGDRYSIGTDEICSNGYEKFYICGAVSEGKCGIDYRGKDVQADIEWDNNVLPYLGFWITAGGFRGDYNCAWEPSSGYYDSVSRALRNNAVWELLPQEEKQFDITITVHENSQRK